MYILLELMCRAPPLLGTMAALLPHPPHRGVMASLLEPASQALSARHFFEGQHRRHTTRLRRLWQHATPWRGGSTTAAPRGLTSVCGGGRGMAQEEDDTAGLFTVMVFYCPTVVGRLQTGRLSYGHTHTHARYDEQVFRLGPPRPAISHKEAYGRRIMKPGGKRRA